jgi:hypothetical protein
MIRAGHRLMSIENFSSTPKSIKSNFSANFFFPRLRMAIDEVGMCKNWKFSVKSVRLNNFISPTKPNLLGGKKICSSYCPLIRQCQ